MRNRWTGFVVAGALASLTVAAQAAENGLLGIKLFDSGTKVISMFGSPDQIEPLNVGGGNAGGAGGAGGAMGGGPSPMGSGGPSPMGSGGGGGGGKTGSAEFSFGDFMLRQKGMGMPPGANMPQGVPPGAGAFGPGGGGGGPSPASSGNAAPAAGGGAAQSASYTRWIYNRSGSKYGFVVDKGGHVVQIEAIGLTNGKVKTSKGVTFGNTFAQVIKKYNLPDGYDIAGDNILARYMTKSRVAFRFSRVTPNKPQVVTGIVVAAGKG